MKNLSAFRIAQAVLALLLLPLALPAQSAPSIQNVRVGLPSGPDSGRTRNGSWAPVYVTLQAGPEGNALGYSLAVETADLDETPYRFTVPVPALAGGEQRVVVAYTLPSADSQDFTVKLEREGRALATLPKVTRSFGEEGAVAPGNVLFLAVGSGLSQLKRAGEKLDAPAPGVDPVEDAERARRQFAVVDGVPFLPDQWFGYDAVDVVVLGTGDVRLVTALLEAEPSRRNALLEWVRRGGRLVISVGRNTQEVARLLEKMPVIDCKVDSDPALKGLSLPTLSFQWCKREVHQGALEKVEAAKLTPGPEVQTLVSEGGRPVLVQSSCGLGRVILVGFDLDSPPFTTWRGQVDFWKQLQAELAPVLAQRPGAPVNVQPNPNMAPQLTGATSAEMLTDLKRGLETFEDIPPVPFGWVALFLLFYIALVGPLDYLVLKKLLKRLELTWVTFPLTVIIVSVAAYATAYLLKGDDLRINKVDLIDIDLHAPKQVYGHTWFSLFSPRVQSYTVGLEPAAPEWTSPPAAESPGPTMTLLEGNERGLRTGSQGLFPKPYEYAEQAAGVKRVPVPVWAARSFQASWQAPLPEERPPIEVRDVRKALGRLSVNPDGDRLVGEVTNNLAVELQGTSLFYRGKWYYLGTLVPGQTFSLFARDNQAQGKDIKQWFTESVLAPEMPLTPAGKPLDPRTVGERSSFKLVKDILFHNLSPNKQWLNTGVRDVDQSWRLTPAPVYPRPGREQYRAEAVLVARTPLVSDRAERATTHAVSPSHVWLGALPGERPDRPALPGFLTQETYLRVYIPVHPTR